MGIQANLEAANTNNQQAESGPVVHETSESFFPEIIEPETDRTDPFILSSHIKSREKRKTEAAD